MEIHSSEGGVMPRRGPNNGGDKRDRILRAAVKIFSRNGFFNSKVSEIARASGVADGTIYLYFKNKDDLLISLLEVISDILEEGKREGAIRPDLNVSVARRAIFGALDELCLTYVLSGKRKYHPSVTAAEVCRLLLEGLCVPGADVGKG